MRRSLLFALALTLSPLHSYAQVERAPAVERVDAAGKPVLRPKDSAKPAPAPSEVAPQVSEPTDVEQALKLTLVFVRLFQQAVQLGTLATVALTALAGVYLLMYLLKTALKSKLPDHYKSTLRTLLGLLTIVATALGYYVGGVTTAAAAGIGAAGSGLFHDIIDSIRSLKTKK